MNGDQIDPESFLACELYSAATRTMGRIIIGGLNHLHCLVFRG